MATRGRKPKPTAMKELEGNPGKHPLNTSEPKPNKKAPACPKWLEPEAKKEWRRLAKQMEAIGILTEVDMAAFAGYCQAYARWKEAEEFITQHGTIVKTPSGYWQQVPQVSLAQTYLKIMNKFAEQFGLTPSSRSRIIASDGGPADAADEMEADGRVQTEKLSETEGLQTQPVHASDLPLRCRKSRPGSDFYRKPASYQRQVGGQAVLAASLAGADHPGCVWYRG